MAIVSRSVIFVVFVVGGVVVVITFIIRVDVGRGESIMGRIEVLPVER